MPSCLVSAINSELVSYNERFLGRLKQSPKVVAVGALSLGEAIYQQHQINIHNNNIIQNSSSTCMRGELRKPTTRKVKVS
jgi:hypothetical protein